MRESLLQDQELSFWSYQGGYSDYEEPEVRGQEGRCRTSRTGHVRRDLAKLHDPAGKPAASASDVALVFAEFYVNRSGRTFAHFTQAGIAPPPVPLENR
jgi:hypothetical protein